MRRARSSLVFAVLASCASAHGGAVDGSANDAHDANAGETAAAPGRCPAGQWRPGAEGPCVPAGVPPSMCADGFTPDGDGGCAPVLPASPCPDGQVAWLGETACHDIVDCGDGPWGNVPIGATTVFVDAQANGPDVDGTAEHPWRTVQDGIDHAASNAIVAIAAGTYTEVLAVPQPVRLWGRCPRLVQIAVPPSMNGQVIPSLAAGTELHAIAFPASLGQALVLGGGRVTGVWSRLPIGSDPGADATVIDHSLIEAGVDGSALWLEQSIVRGGRVASLTFNGVLVHGIVHRSILEGSGRGLEFSAGALSGRVDVSDSLFRDSSEAGLVVAANSSDLSLTIATSTLERFGVDGIDIGAAGTVRVVGTTLRSAGGGGIVTHLGPTLASSATVLDIAGLRVADTPCGLCLGGGSTTSASGVWISDYGVGSATSFVSVLASSSPSVAAIYRPLTLTLAGSLVESAAGVGLLDVDATVDVVGSIVRGTRSLANDSYDGYGDGIEVDYVAHPAVLHVTASEIAGSARAAIASFGANVTIGDDVLADDAIDLDGETQGGVAPSFTDEGGNRCSTAGVDRACVAQSTGLAPPAPVGTP